MSEQAAVSTVFAGIVDLARALGLKSIGKLDAPWEQKIDEVWEIAVNGKGEEVKWRFATVPAFSFIGLRNGFPVIVGDPYGGTVLGHGPEIEDELIERIAAAVERAKEGNQ